MSTDRKGITVHMLVQGAKTEAKYADATGARVDAGSLVLLGTGSNSYSDAKVPLGTIAKGHWTHWGWTDTDPSDHRSSAPPLRAVDLRQCSAI